jgi:spermidine/putrescine transport system substrate-binding protein
MSTANDGDRPIPDRDAQAFVRGALTRRELLRRAGVAGSALTVAQIMAACGGSSGGASSGPPASTNVTYPKTVASSWTFANWPEYIDVANHTHPSLNLFDKTAKTHTNYIENINDNAQFFGTVKDTLAAGQNIGYDIVTLTDWMASKWIQLGYVDPLEKALIPNVEANIQDALKGRSIDPENQYLVPWQSGFTGIGYNRKATGRDLTKVDDLWDPAFKGKVSLLTEMRDTLGLTMLSMGIDPSKATTADAQKAVDKLKPQVASGQVRAFLGNEYAKQMSSGDIVAAMVWSGDMVQLQADNPDLKFAFPDEGCMLWTDNMMIPKGASHPYNAHLWMNFYYQPKIAAMVEDWVNYVCPVKGAGEVLIKTDPSVAKNPLIFPTQEILSKTHVFKALSPQEDFDFNNLFQQLTGV